MSLLGNAHSILCVLSSYEWSTRRGDELSVLTDTDSDTQVTPTESWPQKTGLTVEWSRCHLQSE